MRISLLFLLVICCGAWWGSAPPVGAEESPVVSAETGAATPREAFSKLQAAAAAERWSDGYQMLTTESRNVVTGIMLFDMYLKQGGNEGVELALQVSDKDKAVGLANLIFLTRGEEGVKLTGQLGALVKDQPAFFAQARKLLSPKAWHDLFGDLKTSELTDLKIDGETAQGVMSGRSPDKKKGFRKPVAFKRDKGRWLVELKDYR
jgi:hypothetical protein